MLKEEYEEEMRLIQAQNPVEAELYPIVVDIIQPTITHDLSRRYIFGRQRSNKGQIYYGLSNFPDIAILSKSFINNTNESIKSEDWEQLRGCIEVKRLGEKLIPEKEINDLIKNKPENLDKLKGQLLGDLLWYKKLIYTNGKEWRYLYIEEYSDKLKDTVIDTVNERIKNEKQQKVFNWWKSLKKIPFKYKDKCITKDCTNDWENFLNNIKKIKW